jgi:PAS domain S-box-containing protein
VLASRVKQLLPGFGQVIAGLRFRLLLLVLVACVPLVWLTLHTASETRRREQASWSQRLRRVQRLADLEEKRVIEQARQLLLAIAEAAPVRNGNPRGCQRLLDELFSTHPSYANLGVLTTNGEVLASVRPLAGSGGAPERELFQQARENRSFAVSEQRSALDRGPPLINIGFPAMDYSRQVRAVVFVTLAPDWCNRSATGLKPQLSGPATLVEIDKAGRLLASYPAPASGTSQSAIDPGLLSAALRESEGTYEVRDAKGRPSWHVFATRHSRLLNQEVVTILGIPEEALFAGARRVLLRNLASLGIAVGLALALGWVGSDVLVVQPVRTLVRASARLGAGDLTTRTGLRHGKHELGQLTRAFDDMARALEQREQQRLLAEERLQTRDHMLRELPLFPAAICVCDQLGTIELYNRAAVDLWGGEPGDQDSRRYCGAYQLFHPDGTPMSHEESPMAEALRTGLPVQNRELLIGRSNGTRVPVLANIVPLRDGEGSLIGAVSCEQDLSERRRAEERLQASHDKLHLLSRRLVESQETERRHIARELHDEVGQSLTVAEMHLQAVVQSSRTASLKSRMTESLRAVERVLKQVRDLSLNLRPSMLDDLGLVPALRWYTNRQAAVAGLAAEFYAEPMENRLDPFIETACFRVAQEALTNVVRHARARAVTVELRQQSDQLHLLVRDDGAGFDVVALREQAVQGASLGLLSMEERATLVAGSIQLVSAPGQGTEVRACFPLKWRASDS